VLLKKRRRGEGTIMATTITRVQGLGFNVPQIFIDLGIAVRVDGFVNRDHSFEGQCYNFSEYELHLDEILTFPVMYIYEYNFTDQSFSNADINEVEIYVVQDEQLRFFRTNGVEVVASDVEKVQRREAYFCMENKYDLVAIPGTFPAHLPT
jgi:hypothetical protein